MLTDERRAELIAAAEAKSPFKKFELVMCCQPQGFSIKADGLESHGHDHSNPKHHFRSRVIGWDYLGSVQVATTLTDNPHCSAWPWTDDLVHPRDDEWDWYTGRSEDDRVWQKVGSEIFFMWEDPSWQNSPIKDFYEVGETVKAVLVAPHINYGDWIVSYEKPNKNWITRVVNERQMWKRDPN